MSVRKTFLIGIFILLFGAGMFAAAQTAEEHLKKGDDYYAQRDDHKALESYLAAAQADPNNYEAAWKASRSLFDVGNLVDPAAKDKDEQQKKYYKDAQTYARKAVALKADDTWGHFYLSAALGKYALLLSKKEQVAMSKEIRTEIDKAISLDPANDLAYHALGRWHRRMAEIGGLARLGANILYGGLPKGTFGESEAALKKASELKPNYINHHLELGRTYMALKKYQPAADEFQKCLDLPVDLAKDAGYKKEAEAELAAAKKKIK